MGSYPTSPRSEFLAWCQAHALVFSDNAAAIGLSPQQALAFKNGTVLAATALADQQTAQDAAKATTAFTTMKFNELRRLAGTTVGVIKSFAEATNNPNVYITAQIPEPQPDAPAPPPAQPSDMKVALDPTDGSLTISWKANNPSGTSGTSYIIKRRTSSTASFEFIGVTGSKKYIDTTFFAGPDMVQYTVQGQRADSAGPVSQILTVNFGRVGGGGSGFAVTSTNLSDSTTSGSDVRLAA